MSEPRVPVEEHVKNLLRCLCIIGPASNELTQMLFLLPQKATTVVKMYPELMEREEELMEVLGLRYTERGFIEPSTYQNLLGLHLTGLYRSLFKALCHAERRERLLKLAGASEEEFKQFDPLRAWIDVALSYLAGVDKDALRLLDTVVTKLSGKRPDESVSWDEVKAAVSVRDFEASRDLLKCFSLLFYESTYWVYGRECPLLLEAYSDLRSKLKGLLR